MLRPRTRAADPPQITTDNRAPHAAPPKGGPFHPIHNVKDPRREPAPEQTENTTGESSSRVFEVSQFPRSAEVARIAPLALQATNGWNEDAHDDGRAYHDEHHDHREKE
jgi:hypothetical protein